MRPASFLGRNETASTDDVGRRVIGHLNDAIGAERVRRLLGSDTAVRCEQETLEVHVRDRFSAEMVERRLGDDLRRSVSEVVPGRSIGLRVHVREGSPIEDTPTAAPSTTSRAGRVTDNKSEAEPRTIDGQWRPGSGPSRQTARVPEYVVGAPNRVPFEACRRAACEQDGPELVFVHGPCGVGKTHLLRMAGSMCRRERPDARIRMTTGEGFIGGYVNAIRDKTVSAFQRKHRKLDLLIIDDVHVMAGKEGTQQELVRTLSELQLTGARVILASDAHPREIAKLHNALGSRFVSGVVAPVGRPDQDMVRRLVPALAKRRGLVLDPKGLELLIQRVVEDDYATVRDVEGVLTQIQAMGSLMDQDRALFLSAEHVRKAVEMRSGTRAGIRSGPVRIDAIIETACAELGVTREDLASKGRAKKVVLAREVIVHLGKRHTGRSYPELAIALGRPNHSTVITAHQRFEAKVEAGEAIRVGAAIDGCTPGELVGRLERAMGVDRVSQ
ncbi:MAG: DnaA/Hda family protein [Phycisphaerales bacterium]